MAMDQEEALSLLRHLQEQVREVGLTDFDEAVVSDLRRQDLSPGRMLLAYLEALDAELGLRSRRTARLAVTRLNDLVHSNHPTGVEGAEIRLGPLDARLTEGEAVDLLHDLPDFEPQRAEMRELMAMLREELGLER